MINEEEKGTKVIPKVAIDLGLLDSKLSMKDHNQSILRSDFVKFDVDSS